MMMMYTEVQRRVRSGQESSHLEWLPDGELLTRAEAESIFAALRTADEQTPPWATKHGADVIWECVQADDSPTETEHRFVVHGCTSGGRLWTVATPEQWQRRRELYGI